MIIDRLAFKDLKKRISLQTSTTQQQCDILGRLRSKPFWIWEVKEHKQEDIRTEGDCCFNHIIGLPKKEAVEKPIFDYEKLLYDSLLDNNYSNILNHNFKHKHLWVKKATGLGVTEFFLRLMACLCLRNDDYRNCQMCIVTGPNIDIAIKLIKRMKALFEPKLQVTFDSKETVLELNNCTIEAYPSNHIDAYRALDNPKFILIDEGDFFRKGEQEDVRHVSERYIAKSDPYIVMISTPNSPTGLFENIEKEPEETCIYKRLSLDYSYGLDRIYTRQEIEKAKASPSFERELVWDLIQKYNVTKVLVDASAPSFIRALKLAWGERPDYENVQRELRDYMRVEPVPFGVEHRQLLYHVKFLLENKYLQIHPAMDKLIVSLRSAWAKDNVLDKEVTSHNDVLDAFRLVLRPFKEQPILE